MTLELDRLAALERAATPEPWDITTLTDWSDSELTDNDRIFIAALRNAAPALIAVARRAGEAEALLQKAHDALAWWDKWAMYATGANGHTPIAMPPFQALIAEGAIEASRAVVGPSFALPMDDPLLTEADKLNLISAFLASGPVEARP